MKTPSQSSHDIQFLSIQQIEDIIRSARGKWFSVEFIKRENGEYRRMVARTGVKKGVKNIGLPYNPKNHNLITVWARDVKNFRSVPLDGIVKMRVLKELYE